MALSLKAFAALTFWVAMSASMVLFNAVLLKGFRHPVWLTFWHQFVSSGLVLLLRCVIPSLVSTAGKDGSGLTLLGALKISIPIATAHCLNMICGNTAVMYISVSFCQMIKAWAPVCVYVMGILVGTQKWSLPVAKMLMVITIGEMITSVGEMKVDLYGFIMQLTSLLSDGLRVNLLEGLLTSAGHKLNPLSSVLIFAPVSSVFLLLIGLVSDPGSISQEVLRIGELTFFANALIAFLLNIAVYIAIQVADALVYAMAGIVKDMCIIGGSVIVLGNPVTGMQLMGYSIALMGIQGYSQVSKAPEDFERGVIIGLYNKLKAPQPQPQSIGAAEEPSEDIELEIVSEGVPLVADAEGRNSEPQ